MEMEREVMRRSGGGLIEGVVCIPCESICVGAVVRIADERSRMSHCHASYDLMLKFLREKIYYKTQDGTRKFIHRS